MSNGNSNCSSHIQSLNSLLLDSKTTEKQGYKAQFIVRKSCSNFTDIVAQQNYVDGYTRLVFHCFFGTCWQSQLLTARKKHENVVKRASPPGRLTARHNMRLEINETYNIKFESLHFRAIYVGESWQDIGIGL